MTDSRLTEIEARTGTGLRLPKGEKKLEAEVLLLRQYCQVLIGEVSKSAQLIEILRRDERLAQDELAELRQVLRNRKN